MSDERSMEELLAEWEALTEPIHEAINPHSCTAGRGTCDICEGARSALDGLWRVFIRSASTTSNASTTAT